MNKNYYINILKARLSPERFSHSLLVVETAMKIGEKLALNKDDLWLASLLHDYAKDLSCPELLAVARKNKLITCKVEELQPGLLHGPVGAFLCQQDLQLREQEVLQAICYHTTGHGEMSLLDKVVFLADLLEPSRSYAGVDELRKICEDDLDKGLLLAFDGTLQYLLREKLLIHPLTVQARNRLLLVRERRDIE
ncbi:MAG TPA: HD domain-containing protein [Clostridia bacterium]|nr:bis(5'-nucleosyl)-tetraphosphatase (symmetrical) YqeK [Clostridia bacterium]HHY06426.1 HD domain-containing protein [Clostridia bacterium]